MNSREVLQREFFAPGHRKKPKTEAVAATDRDSETSSIVVDYRSARGSRKTLVREDYKINKSNYSGSTQNDGASSHHSYELLSAKQAREQTLKEQFN